MPTISLPQWVCCLNVIEYNAFRALTSWYAANLGAAMPRPVFDLLFELCLRSCVQRRAAFLAIFPIKEANQPGEEGEPIPVIEYTDTIFWLGAVVYMSFPESYCVGDACTLRLWR